LNINTIFGNKTTVIANSYAVNVGNLENIQQNGDSAMENWRGIKDKGLLQVESNKQTIKPFVKLH